MSAEEFKELKSQEAEAGREDTDQPLSSVALIPSLKASWKKLLFDATLLTLKSFDTDLNKEDDLLKDRQAYARLSLREQFSLQVRYGQKKVLHQLLELAR